MCTVKKNHCVVNSGTDPAEKNILPYSPYDKVNHDSPYGRSKTVKIFELMSAVFY